MRLYRNPSMRGLLGVEDKRCGRQRSLWKRMRSCGDGLRCSIIGCAGVEAEAVVEWDGQMWGRTGLQEDSRSS